MSVANGQHAYPNALFGNFLGGINFKPECIAPYRQTLFDALRGDSDVINFQQSELSPQPQNKGLAGGLQLRQPAGQA